MSLAPNVTTRNHHGLLNSAAGADLNTNLGEAPVTGTVSAVRYIAKSTLTGANTDSRTINLVNKGAAGAGTTVIATLAFVSGTNATADIPRAITLSGTAANLVVTKGDVLQWQSVHVGATGLADPGGCAVVEFSASTTPA